MNVSRINSTRIWLTIIFIAVAGIIGVLSYNTVWLGDDITYAYDFTPGHTDEIVSSLSQIINSMNEHYLTVNGRYIAHVFVQLFCGMWGHLAFAIANSLFYIIFLTALCRLCSVSLDNLRGVVSVTLFALIIFQTKMVPSCQIGYIWSFSLMMIFLIRFFAERKSANWLSTALWGLLSLIAGNGNEALSLGISGALIIFWCLNMRKMTMTQYVMMVCFGLGTLLICVSPGSNSRAAAESVNFLNAIALYKSVTGMFLTLKATLVMVVILLWHKFRLKQSLKSIYTNNAFYFNTLFILIAFNAVIGFGSNRQVFGAELMSIIISIRLLKNHSFNKIILLLGFIILLLQYVEQTRFVFKVKSYYDEIVNQYSRSDDGVVYLDVDQRNHVSYTTLFTPTIPLYGVADNGLYEHSRLAKWLDTRYPGRGEVRILPTMMKSKKNILHSELCPLPQPGLYLVIESENDSLRTFIDRRINKPYLHREYPTLPVDMTDRTLCQGKDWKARYVQINDYTVMGFSSQTIYQK